MNELTSPTPIKNLDILIKEMHPVLGPKCAFCQMDWKTFNAIPVRPLALFNEAEGLTVIYPENQIEGFNLPVNWIGTQITLNVNSSLDAVGFLAKITTALAENGISVNAFSPVSHDHLFVKPENAVKAMEILRDLSRQSS